MKILLPFCLFFLIACNSTTNTETKKDNSYITYLKEQIAQYPDSIALRLSFINALDSLAMYKEALNEMDILIKQDSLNEDYWYSKAQLNEKAKDTAEAIINYKRAIRIYRSADILLSLANLYAETKNDTALLICIEIEDTYTDKKYSADCLFISGVYFARIGNTAKAIELFDHCINTSYSYMVAYLEKGFIFYDKKEYQKALEIFQLAAQVNSAYADAYYWQAKCYEAMNNKNNAIAYYEKALFLDKNLQEANDALKRLQ
ncbi:MAG: tetratricopeptide repeat protein [Chitinophagaceae bacterium]|nr:tetratricopeptide repeat protein [Chitinophagaceae bacterium]MCW5903955.1 tetratricopeptide repeat protein [Chitinophagaceae bacterium]